MTLSFFFHYAFGLSFLFSFIYLSIYLYIYLYIYISISIYLSIYIYIYIYHSRKASMNPIGPNFNNYFCKDFKGNPFFRKEDQKT